MPKTDSPIQRMSPGGLQDYLKKTRQKGRVISALEQHLATRELDKSRPQDVLHPSEMVKSDACQREAFFRIRNAREGVLPEFERTALRLQTIFDVGNAAHSRWQAYLGTTGNMWGFWKCVGCGNTTGPSTMSPWPCGFCGHQSKVYEEVGLHYGLVHGHTDGWLKWGDRSPDSLLEIKTIGTGTIRAYNPKLLMDADENVEKAFRSVRAPFKDHRRQVMTYLWLTREMYDAYELDEKPPADAVVLYELKSNGEVKEFTVQYDEELIWDVMDFAEDVEDALKKDRPPKCSVDPGVGCKKCRPYDEKEDQ